MADDPEIEATGLQKSYGSASVLAGVDLRVARWSLSAHDPLRKNDRWRARAVSPCGGAMR